MSKRRQDDDLLVLVAQAPWWVGVALAAVVFVIMRFLYPAMPTHSPMTAAFQSISRSLSWFVAGLFLLAGAISGFRSVMHGPSGGSSAPAAPSRPCPRCSGALIIRTAKRGARAGGTFWGCTNYPKCHYTEDRA